MNRQNRTTSSNQLSEQQTELIQELVNCALACEACASACLAESDVSMMTRCIELDRDCADICYQASRLLMRDSEVSSNFLGICAEICRLCGEECNKHDLEHCKICAEACERCAELCSKHYRKVEVR